MKNLIVRDMRHHAGRWLWTVIVAAVGSAGLAAVLAVAVAAFLAARSPEELMMVSSATGTVVFFTVMAACVVVASTAGLVIRSHAREHALWKTIGVQGERIRAIILGQLTLIGAAGGVLGIPLTWLLGGWVARQWQDLHVLPSGALIHTILPSLLCPALAAGLCRLGGLSSARRAAQVDEMAMVREAAAPQVRTPWAGVVVAGVLAIGLVTLPLTQIPLVQEVLELEEMVEIPPYLIGSAASLLIMMIALALGPWTLRWAVEATSRLPIPGMIWKLATATARLRATTSTTMTFPFALAMSVVGVAHGTGNLQMETVDPAELTAVFGLVILIAWLGGIANIAMLGSVRTRDGALLATAGGRPSHVTGVVLVEGVLHAASAWLFALVLTVVGMIITGLAAGLPIPLALARGPWTILSVMGLATVVMTVSAVGIPAAIGATKSPVEQLRLVD